MQDQLSTKAFEHALNPRSFGSLTTIQQLHFVPADHSANITPTQFEVQMQAPWQHSARIQLLVGLRQHVVRLKLQEDWCLTLQELRHCILWAFTWLTCGAGAMWADQPARPHRQGQPIQIL
jgi:hypothetical protein